MAEYRRTGKRHQVYCWRTRETLMAMIGEWSDSRAGYLFGARKRGRNLRREMEAHRALMGESPAFGNTLRMRDEARECRGMDLGR